MVLVTTPGVYPPKPPNITPMRILLEKPGELVLCSGAVLAACPVV